MRGCLGAMGIHEEGEHLAHVPRGLARPPLVPRKLHACHRAHRVSGEGWPETGAPWPSSPSMETVNQVHRESLHPWASFLLWIPLPCIYLLLSFPRILWSYIPGPPLVGAGERGLAEAGRRVVIVPCTLPQTGSIFSIYHLSCF